jgi:voltage-gated potassium channel
MCIGQRETARDTSDEYRMPTSQPLPETSPKTRKAVERDERFELLWHVQAVFEPVMAGLGLVFLALLLLDYGSFEWSFLTEGRIDGTLQAIWAIFLVDFFLRLVIAPEKVSFLKDNWLAIISLALPFLRPLRAFRAIRAVRSLSLMRFLGGINRGMRVLRRVTRGAQFAYVGLLTVIVALAAAVGAMFFEDGYASSPIQTFGDALWWSAAMVTTINNEKFVVSPEARALAILLRIFAVSVFGYITASIATYLIGASPPSDAQQDESAALRVEIASLREEVASLRHTLNRPDEA